MAPRGEGGRPRFATGGLWRGTSACVLRLIEGFTFGVGFGRLAVAVVSFILFSFAIGVGFGRPAAAMVSFILFIFALGGGFARLPVSVVLFLYLVVRACHTATPLLN